MTEENVAPPRSGSPRNSGTPKTHGANAAHELAYDGPLKTLNQDFSYGRGGKPIDIKDAYKRPSLPTASWATPLISTIGSICTAKE